MATIDEEKVEIIEVTIGVKTRKEIVTLPLTVISLETSINIHISGTGNTHMERLCTLYYVKIIY